MTRLSWKMAIIPFMALVLAAIAYSHNDIFIDFADEGFLWYGTLQVLQGQVPILNFQAYDPGRYYWCAMVMSVFGKGLMSLRLAAGLFQFVGLSLGMMALRRAIKSPWVLFGAGLLMVFFMLVPWRYFNSCLPPIALFFAVRLIEKPSARRHIAAGICTGLISFIAVNHGSYVFFAFLSLIVYLRVKGRTEVIAKNILYFTGGIILGCIPWFFLFFTVPHFGEAYWERLTMIASAFTAGKAHVSLPIPWPWTLSWEEISRTTPYFHACALEFMNRFSIGVLFIFVILYYFVAAPALIRFDRIQEGPRALFTASVFIGFFYLGHVFARTDLVYLGEGIFPVCAGLFSAWAFLSRSVMKRLLCGAIVLFACLGFLSAGMRSAILFKTMVPKGGMTWYQVGKDRIWLMHPDAEYCDNVKKLVSQYVRPEEPLLLAPLLTTFYCLLGRKSPLYELYFHIAPLPAMEEREIRQLEEKKVRWAIVGNLLIDGRPEQTLARSHPLLWTYLMDHFEIVTNKGLRPGYFLMRRKALSP